MAEKAPVSERAVIARINRKLAQNDEVLHKSRSERARFDLGEFYTVNTRHNVMGETHVDLAALARELGALRGWEEIVS